MRSVFFALTTLLALSVPASAMRESGRKQQANVAANFAWEGSCQVRCRRQVQLRLWCRCRRRNIRARSEAQGRSVVPRASQPPGHR